MTEKDLTQLFYLKREKSMWEDKLAELTEIKSPSFGGSGHGSGISNPVASLAERRDKIMQIIEGKKIEIELQELSITQYIMTLDDSLMRQIMYLRHVKLFSWGMIARAIGGDNTPDGIRMMHKRFLSKQ